MVKVYLYIAGVSGLCVGTAYVVDNKGAVPASPIVRYVESAGSGLIGESSGPALSLWFKTHPEVRGKAHEMCLAGDSGDMTESVVCSAAKPSFFTFTPLPTTGNPAY